MDTLLEVTDNKENVAFGPFNKSYLQLRKLTVKALNKITFTHQASTKSLILEEAAILIDTFLSWKGEPHYINKEIQLCIGSILHQVLYGRDQNAREDKGFQISAVSADEFVRFSGSGNPLDVMPWLKYVMPWKASELHKTLKTFADIRYQHAMNHRKMFDGKYVRCDITDIFSNCRPSRRNR